MLTAAETVHEGSHCHGCILANSVFEVNHACDSQHAFAKSTTSDVQKQNHVAYTGRARQELNNESNQMPDLKMLHLPLDNPPDSLLSSPGWLAKGTLFHYTCRRVSMSALNNASCTHMPAKHYAYSCQQRLSAHASALHPRFSCLDPRFSILHSPFSILDSRFWILDSRSRSSFLDS